MSISLKLYKINNDNYEFIKLFKNINRLSEYFKYNKISGFGRTMIIKNIKNVNYFVKNKFKIEREILIKEIIAIENINQRCKNNKKITKSRCYYCWLAKEENVLETWSSLIRKSQDYIYNLVKDYDTEDYFNKYVNIITTSKWFNKNNIELINECKKRLLPYAAYTKEMMILSLIKSQDIQTITLDIDQTNIIKEILLNNQAKFVIHAGPGAGKTTLLTYLINQGILENKLKRVLFLVYTKSAKKIIENKLKKLLLKVELKKNITLINNIKSQIFVLTMDEYTYKRLRPDNNKNINYFNDENYRRIFLKGVEKGIQNWENYDLVCIDEAQDITSLYENFVKQIEKTTKRIIYAGDPRQEIYKGATFMTNIWKSDNFTKHTIRFNHRSLPNIVSLLNIFSSNNFNDLHVEQISTREGEGNITCEIIKNNLDIATLIVNHSKNIPNNNVLVISPITTEKYNTHKIITSFRQECSNYNKTCQVIGENQVYNPLEPTIYIGNSKNLKGTERISVSLIQADIPYENYNITKYELKRILFVALSRARDNLHIVLSNELRSDGCLSCLSNFLNIQTRDIHKTINKIPTEISVTNDLLNYEFKYKIHKTYKLEELNFYSKDAPDFLGLLVEGNLANKLGLKLPNIPKDIEVKINNENKIPIIYQKNKKIIIVTSKLPFDLSIFNGNNEFNFAKLKYSLIAGQLWTLSDEFKQCNFDQLNQYVNYLNKNIGKSINRGNIHNNIIYADRSNLIIGQLTGITDIETKSHIIECKHATKNNKHIKQAQIYGTMANKKSVIVNTKKGEIIHLKNNLNKIELLKISRAILASKQAISYRKNIIKPIIIKDIPDTIICVDIETIDGIILEIGAVVFSRSSSQVLEIYHDLSDGVHINENPQDNIKLIINDYVSLFNGEGSQFDVKKECGFTKIDNDIYNYRDIMIQKFKQWLDNFNEYNLLQWSGNDSKTLGVNVKSIDMWKLYKIYLENNNEARKSNTKLSDAVNHILNPNFFKAHRALEDAIATMAIFITLT